MLGFKKPKHSFLKLYYAIMFSEEKIKTTLKDKGYILMTPRRFDFILGKLASSILDGFVSLPINNKDLIQLIH